MHTLHLYRAGKELPCVRWRFKAANGRILAHGGESYKRRRDMIKALAVVFPEFEDGYADFEMGWGRGPTIDVRVKDDTRP